MLNVTSQQLDGIRASIAKLDDAVKAKAMDIIDDTGIDDADKLRKALIGGLAPVCEQSAKLAAQIAASCYNAWRSAAVGETMETVTDAAYDEGKLAAAVNTAVKKAVGGATAEAVLDVLAQRAAYDNRASYGNTIAANMDADEREVRWARVPSGLETCEFCLMLASRGFVYRSKETAGGTAHYHANCRCVQVPSWDEASVEGYDPKELRSHYREMLEGHELNETYELLERNGKLTSRVYKTAAYDYKEALKESQRKRK